jgi:hypothetical protein
VRCGRRLFGYVNLMACRRTAIRSAAPGADFLDDG